MAGRRATRRPARAGSEARVGPVRIGATGSGRGDRRGAATRMRTDPTRETPGAEETTTTTSPRRGTSHAIPRGTDGGPDASVRTPPITVTGDPLPGRLTRSRGRGEAR